ncbi:MAG: hypothetical protein J0H49_19245 [Acidobacteria bacterium]|nr:hypothetical protein [Acidobacteriota bacterium]
MDSSKQPRLSRGIRQGLFLVLIAVPVFPNDKTPSAPALPPEVADKFYSTLGKLVQAGEQWRACIATAGVDFTQLREIRSHRVSAKVSQVSLQETLSSAGEEAKRLAAVTPRTPEIRQRLAVLEAKWNTIGAQLQELNQQLKQFDTDETQFRAELEKQKACISSAPATMKALVPEQPGK